MPIYKIRGIDVDFPFEAYDCQIVYMEKVIKSLQEGCNALLESPTGTGKTLCLLCATLGWRKSLGAFSTKATVWNPTTKSLEVQEEVRDLPTIIYTSRTHSQLQQVVRELKTSNYRPKMVILGSREQMCINDEVQILQGSAQTNACHSLCKKKRGRSCSQHACVSDYMKNNPALGNDPIDIEDLVNIGRTQGPCPYYVSRELHKVVDILFAPYNYLIDPGNRSSLTGIQWKNTVLIFDEAHNLESICTDAASFDLPSGHLAACISEANECVGFSVTKRTTEKSDDSSFDPDNFAILKALLQKFEKRIAQMAIESKELGFTRPGPYIYELFADLNINYETANMLMATIDNAAFLLEDGKKLSHKMNSTICRLESMRDILRLIFRGGDKAHAKFYRVHVHESHANSNDAYKGKTSKILSWWCFNPGIAMEEFVRLGVRSIIVTSGTLSPLDSFAKELNLEFPVRLENPHVISSNQVWVGVVPTGPSGCSLNSSYRNRDCLGYKQELGNTIVNFARIVPDGLLVFFPSYYLMDQCVECWKNTGHTSSTSSNTIWERICKHKQPVIEPKQSTLFPYSVEDFKAKLNDKSTTGAIFFAVCRGKVSEGLDFADQAGRAVVITGIPFAMKTDPKIRLKREYLDQHALSQKKDCKVLTGEEWYSQQAARAVNQAVGRVIRHCHDYGAIIFCDERFVNRQHQMSLWLRPHVKCYHKFGDVVLTLTRFFRERGTSLTMPKLTEKNERELSVGQQHNKILSAKIGDQLTRMAEDCSKRPLSALLADNRGEICNQLGVVPDNCSTISLSMTSHQMSLKHSEDLFFYKNRLETSTGVKGDPQYQDFEVVDLTSNCPAKECQTTDSMKIPCSSKKNNMFKSDPRASHPSENYVALERLYNAKPTCSQGVISFVSAAHKTSDYMILPCSSKEKKLKSDPEASQQSEDYVSHEKFCNVGPKCSQSLTSFTSITCNNSRTLFRHPSVGPGDSALCNSDRISQCAQVPLGTIIQDAACECSGQENMNTVTSSVTCDAETRGSAFLMQVQEKLPSEEYKEFVGLLKAIQSKSIKIVPVLESIARLFSSPERLVLLKRFKDFVPVKYQPMYEQHLKAHDTSI